MAHLFDPGYTRRPYTRLVSGYPEADVYPPEDFRIEWGPVFHRGRLDGSARILVLGQDPGAHECVARRILVGEAGQRVQGFLRKLGIEESYVLLNVFLYSVFGQWSANRHKDDPAIAEHRHAWMDAVLVGRQVQAVLALGTLADHAFQMWKATPSGQSVDVAYQAVRHPTFPEGASRSGHISKAEAMKEMLAGWNAALQALKPVITHPDVERDLVLYGEELDEEVDLAPIPERDLPPGTPAWMYSLDAWAARLGQDKEAKRATIVVTVPRKQRPWPPLA